MIFFKKQGKDRIESNKNFKRNNLVKWRLKLKISLPKDVLDTINKDLELSGNTESERIQNIVISSVFLNSYNKKSDKHTCDDYNNDLHVLEYMIHSIVELLEDKKDNFI